MRIKECETFILKTPLGSQQFYSSQCAFPERSSLIVRIETEDGVVGWGEGGQYGPPEPVASCINDLFASQLVGKDPRNVVRIWEELYALVRDFGHQGPYIEAISAIDIALWDITGHVYGQPVHQLLGGRFRDAVTAYATGGYYRPEDMRPDGAMVERLANEVRAFGEDGFTIAKIKIGLLDARWDLERVRAAGEALGENGTLLVDANHAYNTATALRLAREFEQLDIGWFEEPVVPEDRRGYTLLRNSVSIPIAGGECEHTRYGFRDLLAEGCVDIAQPDICVAGGLSEFVRILALATAYGVRVIPHVWGSGVAIAAALQALAVVPLIPHSAHPVPLQNEPVVEFDRSPNPLRDELVEQPFRLVDGQLPIPTGSGLGITVRRSVLEKYRHE